MLENKNEACCNMYLENHPGSMYDIQKNLNTGYLQHNVCNNHSTITQNKTYGLDTVKCIRFWPENIGAQL